MTLRNLAAFIFEDFLPREEVEKYERVIFGQKLTLRERFISHFEQRGKVPKYNEEISRIILLEIAEKTLLIQKTFLNFRENEDGSYYFDFGVFDPLMTDGNFYTWN